MSSEADTASGAESMLQRAVLLRQAARPYLVVESVRAFSSPHEGRYLLAL